MTNAAVMEVTTEVGGVKVEVHPTGQVRVQGSHMVKVLFSGRASSGKGDARHVELVAMVSMFPDDCLRVEIRRALGPWFGINPALVARLDPDTGRGARVVVSSSGGERGGSKELGSVPVEEPEPPEKPLPKEAAARKRRSRRPKAATKSKSSRDLVRG